MKSKQNQQNNNAINFNSKDFFHDFFFSSIQPACSHSRDAKYHSMASQTHLICANSEKGLTSNWSLMDAFKELVSITFKHIYSQVSDSKKPMKIELIRE